jgi:hypothetical protein
MSREITQDIANKIREKLCGEEKPKTTSGHDVYAIRHGGQVVGKISVRRSSKEVGHDYIPGEINVNMHFAKEIGSCHKSFDDYIECLRSKGQIAKEPQATLLPPKARYPWEKDWVAIQENEAKELAAPDPESENPGEPST